MSGKNKSKYKAFQPKRKHTYRLEPGLSGFLCTCNSKSREKDCVREAYGILNEFADKLFGPEDPLKRNVGGKEKPEYGKAVRQEEDDDDDEDEDIDNQLKKEVEAIKAGLNKKPELRRFQVVESGANGIVFVRSTVPDPVKLANTIVTSLAKSQKSRFLLRLLPVEMTCKAYLDDICQACVPLVNKYFSAEHKTFAIVFNHRNNDSIKREVLIERVAEMVFKSNDKNKADLKNPQLVILIEVIRNVCCLSVVPDFYTLRKYNLMEMVQTKQADWKVTQSEPLEEETQV